MAKKTPIQPAAAEESTSEVDAPKYLIEGIPYPTDADLPAGATFYSRDIELSIGAAHYILQERGETKVYRQIR